MWNIQNIQNIQNILTDQIIILLFKKDIIRCYHIIIKTIIKNI